MYGPANRFLRSTGIVLGLSCAAAGCQSVTQQKMAWSFPPLREEAEAEDRPIITVQNQSLPPLPTDYERWLLAQTKPGKALANEISDGLETPSRAETSAAPLDTALVRTSAVTRSPVVPDAVKLSAGLPSSSFMQPPRIPFDPPKPASAQAKSAEALPVAGQTDLFASKAAVDMPTASVPPEGVKPPPAQALVALDPKTTQQIVKKIVGATDDILRTGLEEDLIEEGSLAPARSNPYGIRDLRPKARSGKDTSVRPATHAPAGSKSATERPTLETLAAEPVDTTKPLPIASLKPPLLIPKAAICRAVEGRGRFLALPAHLRAPGSTVIIYWELDGLARDSSLLITEFTAIIELLALDRDEILASVRETVRETGAAPAEGDYAALRWTIPAEIDAGDYRIRISVTEAASKRKATTEIDLALGRGPVASRFVLP